MKKEKKILDPEENDDIVGTSVKLLTFTSAETNENTDYGKYEPFNILSQTGDSIYTSTSSEVEQKGKEYVVIEIVSKKLDGIVDQVGLLQRSIALLRKDLVATGVLKAA